MAEKLPRGGMGGYVGEGLREEAVNRRNLSMGARNRTYFIPSAARDLARGVPVHRAQGPSLRSG